jgi:hypothetical protein
VSTAIPRQKAQLALQAMARKAREAREAWQRELAACQEKGLVKPGKALPASLAERYAHWTMAHLMLHIAVSQLLYSGQNNVRVDRYVSDLIAGERWPTETGTGTE